MDQRIATIADATPMDLPALSCWRKHDASERIASQLEAGSRVRVIIETPVALLGRAMALAVARSLGTRLVQAAIPPELAFHERAELFMRVNRIALLAGYVPCWTQPPSPWPLQPRGAPLQFVIAEPGHCPPPAPGLSDILMSPPLLDVKGRVELLNWAVPQSANWPAGDTGKLVGHSAIGADDILHLRAAGVENVAEAVGVLNTATLRRIGAAGTVMDRSYDWDDIVLPPKVLDNLRSIPFEHHHRRQLLDNVAKGALRHYEGLAISALFCGASGTGKTMAAQVIARDIGAELIRVDMASTISKYIGETAKNLRRIFEHAAGANTIIMFDEADALFAKRTDIKDAHDRHANADTTYLLQLIESFDGAVLLATNKRENIDPAFMRRIRHVVDFPQPGPDERLRIWTLHLRNLSTDGGAACTAQVAAIAPGIELSPAQIRNAAITAAYAALARKSSSIGASDIMAGLERELGKDGRTLGVAQRKRLESHG